MKIDRPEHELDKVVEVISTETNLFCTDLYAGPAQVDQGLHVLKLLRAKQESTQRPSQRTRSIKGEHVIQ